MPMPTDPERQEEWRRKCLAALMRGREPKYGCVCRHCGLQFLGRDVKSSRCDSCRFCPDCGKPVKNAANRRCKRCSKHSERHREQRARLHASMRGGANPAKRPEVRAKLSAGLRANHPCRNHPEQWAAHIASVRPDKVSKVEDMVAPFLPGWTRQYRVQWYALDFADPSISVAVEVMGCWHHACPSCFPEGPTHATQKLVARNDKSKRTFLSSRGWLVIDIPEHEVRVDPEGAIHRHVYDNQKVQIRSISSTRTYARRPPM